MILIGQYDSPFVRRVGIALTLYDLPFEHWPWSVFGDGEKIAPLNPLVRVPTLKLDDGLVLVESHAMLDHLDGLVPPERALFPREEPARHRAVRVAALAMGLAEKAVSLFSAARSGFRRLGRALPRPDRRRPHRVGARAGRTPGRLVVRRSHRPCRHRARLRATIRRRCPSRPRHPR